MVNGRYNSNMIVKRNQGNARMICTFVCCYIHRSSDMRLGITVSAQDSGRKTATSREIVNNKAEGKRGPNRKGII